MWIKERLVLYIVSISSVIVLCSVNSHAEDAYESVFVSRGKVLAFNSKLRALESFDAVGEKLRPHRQLPILGHVQQLADTSSGVVIATGQGRGDMTAPLRLYLLQDLSGSPKLVFEHPTERSQITFLALRAGHLWITFFESKFGTRTGYFESVEEKQWRFREVVSQRLGDATEVLSEGRVVIGRPYGDLVGQDGDLQVYEHGAAKALPSYRGVRAVSLNMAGDAVFVSDGWHQNYGAAAQARLNILRFNEREGAYSLQLLARDTSQYYFRKIFPLRSKRGDGALVVGNKKVSLIGPAPAWLQQDLYESKFLDAVLDAAVLETNDSVARVVVLDGELKLLTVALER